MTTYFADAQRTTIGANANFQTVAGNATITNHYHKSERGDLITVVGASSCRYRSQSLKVDVASSTEGPLEEPKGASTSRKSQTVKVKRTSHIAEIFGYSGNFTTTTYEPVDENDRDNFEKIMKKILETTMRQRSVLLDQIFAVAKSSALTLIAHDELMDGYEFIGRYRRDNNWIVFAFLQYTQNVAAQSLRANEGIACSVTHRLSNWSYNIKNLSWQYDPTLISLSSPSTKSLEGLSSNQLAPVCQDTLRQLDAHEIIACVKENFDDFLHLTLPFEYEWRGLVHFVRYGLLTYGAVVDFNEPDIIAHFPATPTPEWYCKSISTKVKASYSSPWRVDIAFPAKPGGVQVKLKFCLRLREEDRNRLRCAYLYQSLYCYKYSEAEDVREVACIDSVGFSLEGNFDQVPSNFSTPAYLFVPPLRAELINGMHCVNYPLPQSLFYWSHDPQGRQAIAEEDREKFKIPRLSVEEYVGSLWSEPDYGTTQQYLCLRNYDPDGRQYALDHGYPELMKWDPHVVMMAKGVYPNALQNEWMQEALNKLLASIVPFFSAEESSAISHQLTSDTSPDTSHIEQVDYSDSDSEPEILSSPGRRLAVPPTSSLAEVPAPAKCDTEDMVPTLPKEDSGTVWTHWAEPGFLKKFYNLMAQVDALDYSVVAC
ncbi:hypothetical protein PQX77_012012 [Marasmius sp. AFHP31]|nr:hypothetical protein PQX77_012012 [Marasmius sp. AFHP31]